MSKSSLEGLKEIVEDRRMYDIMAALRGPDAFHGKSLKLVFTARLRFYVGLNTPKIRISRSTIRMNLLSKKDLESAFESYVGYTFGTGFNAIHYLNHFVMACLALERFYPKDSPAWKEIDGLAALACEFTQKSRFSSILKFVTDKGLLKK